MTDRSIARSSLRAGTSSSRVATTGPRACRIRRVVAELARVGDPDQLRSIRLRITEVVCQVVGQLRATGQVLSVTSGRPRWAAAEVDTGAEHRNDSALEDGLGYLSIVRFEWNCRTARPRAEFIRPVRWAAMAWTTRRD
jgi:hypothetical protein